MVGIHNCLGDGKAQAVVLIVSVPGGIHTVEPFKYPLPVFHENLLARVDYGQLHNAVIFRQRQAHLAASLAVANGIIQQDGHKLL